MFVALAIINNIFHTYLDSFKRDLGEAGFNMVLILALNAWAGGLILFWLLFRGQFQMPTDPMFYALWFGLTFLTEISFTLMLLGMLNTTFFAASSIANISFVMTALYAALFLHERYTWIQIVAIIMAGIGTLLFFKTNVSQRYFSDNKGLLLILFSLLLTPLEYVLYKAATLHASSYHQFLTGRLTMDLFFYTLFFVLVTGLWFRENPWPKVVSFFRNRKGPAYLVGHTATELLESWLIYKIPISLLTMLATLSVPTSYFVGRKKYQEQRDLRHVVGALLIIIGVIGFLIEG